jgi:hypothetical protein
MSGRAGEAGAEPQRPDPRWIAPAVAALSLAGTLLLLECGLRVAGGSLTALPHPGGVVRMVGERYPGSHHPRLGYVPTPGEATGNIWNTRVTVTQEGLRSNGAARVAAGPPLVAVGDSFTFGDEVSDHETWPAQLEERLGRPVLNGGVFGYGFDQIVLRAEQLLELFPEADTLVVSLIPADVLRCEYAYRYAWKPWFGIEDGRLVLHGVPVPEPHQGPPGEALWRRALRWSFLGDFVMRRLDPDGWMLPDGLRVHRRGGAVARLLVDRLAALAAERRLTLLLVLQWDPLGRTDPAEPVLAQAAERGIPVLEIERRLRAEIGPSPARLARFFRVREAPGRPRELGHMTPEGNGRVAAYVAEALAELAPAPRAAADGRPTRRPRPLSPCVEITEAGSGLSRAATPRRKRPRPSTRPDLEDSMSASRRLSCRATWIPTDAVVGAR